MKGIKYNMIMNREDHVHYLTTTKGLSHECTCSSPEL